MTYLPTRYSSVLLADGKLDFLLTPEQFLSPDHPRELLFEERHVVVGWSENPVFQSELTEDAYHSCGHIAVQITGNKTFIEEYLQKKPDRRRIEFVTPSFALVPWLLPGTNLLALIHERLANAFLPLLPLTMAESPVPLPQMREMIQYHTARSNDQGCNGY